MDDIDPATTGFLLGLIATYDDFHAGVAAAKKPLLKLQEVALTQTPSPKSKPVLQF